MAITLWSDELQELKKLLADALQKSEVEYRRLIAAFREHDPTITDERIEAMRKRLALPDAIKLDDGETVVYGAAHYAVAQSTAARCVEDLSAGRATSQTVIAAHAADSALWRWVAMLAYTLKGGGRVTKSLIADEIEIRRQRDFTLQAIQDAFDAIYAETGKPPSQRAVARRSGFARETVDERWSQIIENRPK